MNGDNQSIRGGSRRSPYAVLNLPPSCGHGEPNNISGDRIRESYRRLSRLLHPDKQPPGQDREDAQEIFIEVQQAYEILEDPALRQAYDHFGHSAVTLVLHNRYAPDSLYRNLSALHADGKSTEALESLLLVLEDAKQKQRQKEWEFNADIEVNMHACSATEVAGSAEWFEVSSTNVSVTAAVPTQTASQSAGNPSLQQKPNMQLSIGGQSNLDNGMGSTRGVLATHYQPVPHTNVSSEITVGREQLETSLSSSTQLANGTGLSAKMTRQLAPGTGERKVAFGFSSQRSLTLFHGRVVQAMFALGVASDLKMHYGVLSFTTWGFRSAGAKNKPAFPPRLSAKLQMGSQFPIECSIDQSNLFESPHRSGRVSGAWSPMQGYKLKGLISRTLSSSEFAPKLGMGVEHSGVSGFKWLVSYQRPEGLSVRVPIFVSRISAPGYWQKVLWVTTLSYLLDETLGEWMGHAAPRKSASVHKAISTKLRSNRRERQWVRSMKAQQNAEGQLSSMMAPVANMKRQREESSHGLVILKATYASSLSSKRSWNDASLDVTQQLQFWVEHSRLYLPASSKRGLLGFYALSEREHHAPDASAMSTANTRQTGSTVSSLSDKMTHVMNLWLSYLGFGGEDGRDHDEQDNCSNDNDDSVILTVRYKYKEQVCELSIRDDDMLELPNSTATVLGPCDRVS